MPTFKPNQKTAAPEEKWYVNNNRHIHGPITDQQLQVLIAKNKLTSSMRLRYGANGPWLSVKDALNKHPTSQKPVRDRHPAGPRSTKILIWLPIGLGALAIAGLATAVTLKASSENQKRQLKAANYSVENASKKALEAIAKGDYSSAQSILNDALQKRNASNFAPAYKAKSELYLSQARTSLTNGQSERAEELANQAIADGEITVEAKAQFQRLTADISLLQNPSEMLTRLKTLTEQQLDEFIETSVLPESLNLWHPALTEQMTSGCIKLAETAKQQLSQAKAAEAALARKAARFENAGREIKKIPGNANIDSFLSANAKQIVELDHRGNALSIATLDTEDRFQLRLSPGNAFDLVTSLATEPAFSPKSDVIAAFNVTKGRTGLTIDDTPCVTSWNLINNSSGTAFAIPSTLSSDPNITLEFPRPKGLFLTENDVVALVEYSRKTSVLLEWDRETTSQSNALLLSESPGKSPIGNPVTLMAMSRDGKLLAYTGSSRRITVLDFASKEVAFSVDAESEVVAIAFDQRGERIFAAGFDCELRCFDIPSRKMVQSWRIAEHDRVMAAKHRAAVFKWELDSQDESLRVYEGKSPRVLPPYPRWGFASLKFLRVAPDDNRVYVHVAGPPQFNGGGEHVVIDLGSGAINRFDYKSSRTLGFTSDGDSLIFACGESYGIVGSP